MHIDLNQGTIRFYATGKDHDHYHAFDMTIDCYVIGDENIILSGAWGHLTKTRYLKLRAKLKEMGIKYVMAHLPTDFKPRDFKPLPPTNLHIMEI